MIKKCKMCGIQFVAKTKRRDFCSDSCKLKHHRLPAHIHKLGNSMMTTIEEFEAVIRNHPELATETYEEIVRAARKMGKVALQARSLPSFQNRLIPDEN